MPKVAGNKKVKAINDLPHNSDAERAVGLSNLVDFEEEV